MEYRRLGSLEVSVVGIGCNNFGWRTDAAGTAAVVDAALEAGINFFFTAGGFWARPSGKVFCQTPQGPPRKGNIFTQIGRKKKGGKASAAAGKVSAERP